MRKKNLIVVVLLCLFSFVIYAESIDIEIRSFTTASSADTSPFWISSNDYGVIGGDPYQIGSTLSIYQDIPLTEKIKIDYSVVGALNSTEEYTGRFIEGFLRFKWKKFYTYAGRMKQTIGST